MTGDIGTVGIAGTGLIGAGWAARLLIRGFDVIAYDVSPAAEAKLKAAIDVAWPSMRKLLAGPRRRRGKLNFTTDLAKMAEKADFIHEAAPEREDLKIKLFREIDRHARPEVIIASSSSGFLPTRLQSECRHPDRVVIGHPFNPVYLLPLVETVPGRQTSREAMDRAGAYFESIGMHVLRLKREIEGYICDRLQEALWREALHILDKDIGTTGDIDDFDRLLGGAALGLHGIVSDLSPGWRPWRHARLHQAVRSDARTPLDGAQISEVEPSP